MCDLPGFLDCFYILRKAKSVQKSNQVAEKQKILFTRPTPGQRRRCDGPTPGRTPG